MKIETLVSTMHLKHGDVSNVKSMNVAGDVLVCNQSNENSFYESGNSDLSIKVFTLDERGIGLSRNTLLLRSKAEICLFADDDIVYEENYNEIVIEAFKKRPDIDIIIFNLKERYHFLDKGRDKKVNWINFSRYGMARIAFKRDSIIKNHIFFNLYFGGGTMYGSGEDTLFLKDCLKAGMKIVQVNDAIGMLTDDRESTWFEGFNEKYYFDKGALFQAISPKLFLLTAVQYSFRKYKLTDGNLSFFEVFKLMVAGSKAYKKRYSYSQNIKKLS